jgi:hypothetical protein
MAEASFDFQMADRQIRRIVALTCENHNQFCVASLLGSYLAVVLARTPGGIQPPAGEGTEISLLLEHNIWSGARPGGLTLRLRDSWGTEVRGW